MRRLDILVRMHSYVGFVGSEAVLEESRQEKRKEKGLAGGVLQLFLYFQIEENSHRGIINLNGN